MLLNAEELLALLNGDVEPDRLADLLDRLEHCPESDAALQALVALRANREEGLEALRHAAEVDSPSTQPIQHPSSRRFVNPSAGWGMQGLRLAASITLVAVIGVWGATTLLERDSVTDLATLEYKDSLKRADGPFELTAEAEPSIPQVAKAFEAGKYAEGLELLDELPVDDEAHMYRGIGEYFLKNFEGALTELEQVDSGELSGVQHQTDWYKANALLALDRPFEAAILLGKLRNATSYGFQPEAAAQYEALCSTMGISNCTAARD